MNRRNQQRFSTFSSNDGGPVWNMVGDEMYGREEEIQFIQSLADDSSTNILVLKGLAGCGKSCLIETQPWEDKGWIFASGKYEQRRLNEPYSALIDALNHLVDQWMDNNNKSAICQMAEFVKLQEEDIVLLRNILPKAFQINGGCQAGSTWKRKYVSEGGSSFGGCGSDVVNASFWRILSFLCKPKPVVLFLDDIQWADQASLDAIKVLATTGKVEGLLLAMAYREEEIDKDGAVSNCLDYIQEEGQSAHTLHVTNLKVECVNEFVSALLRQEPEKTVELSKVVQTKTDGNPFFVMHFMNMLRQERFITYSLMSMKWAWGDVDKIQELAHVSDNVADVIAANMSNLPPPTLIALKSASCLGKVIPLQVMIDFFDVAYQKFKDEFNCILCDALKHIKVNGFKDVLDSAVNFGILTRSDNSEVYTWAHDKLQSVAYSMIPEEKRCKIHATFGELLWKMSRTHPEDEWMLYMAADQMNRVCLDSMVDHNFREEVAKLSLEAGKLSMYKSAFYPALEMIQRATVHLQKMQDPWVNAYDLSLDVWTLLSEVSVRLGKFEEAERGVKEVLDNARSLEDKFQAQQVMIRCEVSSNHRDYSKGADLLKDILLDYDIKFPKKLLPGQQFLETKKFKARLGDDLESLMDLPRLDDDNESDRKYHHIIALLSMLATCAYMVPEKRSLAFFACTRALNTSIKHGVCSATALCLSGWSMNLADEGHYKEACEFGNFAMKFVDTFPVELGSPHVSVHTGVTASVFSYCLPFNNLLDPFLESNRMGLQCGDTEKASMALFGYSFSYLCVGLSLGPLDKDLIEFSREARQFGMAGTIQVLFFVLRQMIQNLKEVKPDPTLFDGDIFCQEKELKKFSGPGLKMTERDVNTFRLVLACIYRKWEVAADLIDALEPFLETDKFVVRMHLRHTYMGIACIILGDKATKRKAHYRQLGKKIIRIAKDLLKNGSQNALPLVQLFEAYESKSKKKFDEAIRSSARLGLLQYQALLYEQQGLNFLDQKDEGWAEYYLSQACNIYTDWGATGKVEQLKQEYDHLLKKSSLSLSSPGSSLKGRTRYDPSIVSQLKELDWTSSNSKQSWASSGSSSMLPTSEITESSSTD